MKPSLNTSSIAGLSLAMSLWTVSTKLAEQKGVMIAKLTLKIDYKMVSVIISHDIMDDSLTHCYSKIKCYIHHFKVMCCRNCKTESHFPMSLKRKNSISIVLCHKYHKCQKKVYKTNCLLRPSSALGDHILHSQVQTFHYTSRANALPECGHILSPMQPGNYRQQGVRYYVIVLQTIVYLQLYQ